MKKKTFTIQQLTKLALMITVLFILGFTPLGYLPNPVGQAITLMPTAVAVGAMVLGPVGGGILGTVMGLLTFYKGGILTGFATMTLLGYSGFTGAVLSFCNAVFPRLLMGFCVGWIYQAAAKIDKTKTICCYVGGLAAPVLNTLFYMTVLVVIYMNAPTLANVLGEELLATFQDNVILFVAAYVGVQALVEAAVGCVIAGTVCKALGAVRKR